MMAFFLTMPISRMMPISAMTLSSVWQSSSASSAPTPADGSVERIVIGWIIAFVEHAEHDVDRHQRGRDQQRFVGQRCLKGLRRALKAAAGSTRADQSRCSAFSMAAHRVAERQSRLEIEGEGDRQETGPDDSRTAAPWTAA